MQQEIEHALRGMIQRDFNHPSIFAWVPFNETWGLFTRDRQDPKKRAYQPATQEWVASIYRLAKQLDPTRLVEDNSPCNHDHVETDINSWHAYLPGYAWREHLTRSRATRSRLKMELHRRAHAGRTAIAQLHAATSGVTKAARATWTGAGITTS